MVDHRSSTTRESTSARTNTREGHSSSASESEPNESPGSAKPRVCSVPSGCRHYSLPIRAATH